MDCFDVSLAVHSLIGISLIVSGSYLMIHNSRFARGYGAFCFALGYFILGLAASGQNVDTINFASRRYLIGIGSIVAIVAGTFMMYYHVQERVASFLKNRLENHPTIREDIINSIPVIDHVLIYAGFAGLVLTISLENNNTFNAVKAVLAVGALLAISYTKNRMLQAMVSGQDVQQNQLAHLFSWGLLVIAIAYIC